MRADHLGPVAALLLGAVLLLAPGACSAGAGPSGTTPGAAAPVERETRLPVDGAELYLLTRGADRTAPLLLWLHGGPGGAETPLFRLFHGALEERFVVAYWDQRGAGRSFDPDADPAALRVARHLADLDAVATHLLASLGREQLALVGHSWGAALGLLYAQARPERVAALVAVAPLVSLAEQQQAQLAFVREEAMRRGDAEVLEALGELGPPPYGARDDLALGRLVDRFGGLFQRRPSFAWTVLRGVVRGLVAPWEIPRFIRANELSLEAMNRELLALDLRERVTSVRVPVAFFLGRFDRQADARLSAAYFQRLEAPAKELVWFEHSAHNVPFEEPERFGREIVERLAPRFTGSGTVFRLDVPRMKRK